MTQIIGYSILPINIDKLKKLAEELGKTMTVQRQGGVKFEFQINPDLTVGQKTILQKVLDATGEATIT